MKLNPNQSSTQQQTFETFEEYQEAFNKVFDYLGKLKRPNPPTEDAIKRAQFVDKTYVWNQK